MVNTAFIPMTTPDLDTNGQHKSPSMTILEFNATEQAKLCQAVKKRQFSGQVIIRHRKGLESRLYFFLGRILFAGGGCHPMRRWYRLLNRHVSPLLFQPETLKREVAKITKGNIDINWQYQLLSKWVKEEKISRDVAAVIIRELVCEVLFDLTQAKTVNVELKPDKTVEHPLTLINCEEVIADVWKQWQSWEAKLGDRSPNFGLVIHNSKELQAKVSEKTYQFLQQSVDGKNSLRDLSVYYNQELVRLGKFIRIYLQTGLLELVEIPDLPDLASPVVRVPKNTPEKPLVAYVSAQEDLGFNQLIQSLISRAGYRLINILDVNQVLPQCLGQKPQIILLNSQINIQEICQSLRQIPVLQYTPIFVVGGHLNLIERMRVKMMGVSEILEDMRRPEVILETIDRYLTPTEESIA